MKWKETAPRGTYSCTYRVFSFRLGSPARSLSFDSVFNRTAIAGAPMLRSGWGDKKMDGRKLTSNGSLGRSLAFGNRQNAVLNSSLNLQLSGYIGDRTRYSFGTRPNQGLAVIISEQQCLRRS
ncbi:MAG: hypothetical protein ACKO03_09735 [Bacteroidota bacterium]